MAEHVALPDLERALARQLAAVAVGIEHVVRRRAWPTPREPVGQMLAAIRAKLQGARDLEEAVLALHGEPTPMLARASGVRHIAIALDEERILRLDHLDGVVGEIHHARAAGI